MGVVANAASDIPGVLARDYLREGFRFGGVRLVANDAKLCGVGEDGFLTGEVLRVASQRPMAGFASNIGMRTFAFCGNDVVMAGSAGLARRRRQESGRRFHPGSRGGNVHTCRTLGEPGPGERRRKPTRQQSRPRPAGSDVPSPQRFSSCRWLTSKCPTVRRRTDRDPRPLRIQAGKEVLRRLRSGVEIELAPVRADKSEVLR